MTEMKAKIAKILQNAELEGELYDDTAQRILEALEKEGYEARKKPA